MKNHYQKLSPVYFAIICMLTLLQSAHSQQFKIDGVSIHSTANSEDFNFEKAYEDEQIFIFSFNDRYFVHQVYDEEYIVQFYRIQNIEHKINAGMDQYTITVKSGLTQRIFTYTVFIDASKKAILEFNGKYYAGITATEVRSYN